LSILNLNDPNALLLFRVGPILVCSPTMQVEAVVLPPKITVPPGSNIAEPGVFKSIHGMVRIVDLRVRFGVDENDFSDPGRIVIVEVEGGHVGFWVDEIEDVISYPGTGWSQVPAYIPRNVFSKTLIQKKSIRLYADFEQLDKLKATGYLRKHIEIIKAAEKKLEEEGSPKRSAGRQLKNNNKYDYHEQRVLQAKNPEVDSALKSNENCDDIVTGKSNGDELIKQNSNKNDINKFTHVSVVEKKIVSNTVDLSGVKKAEHTSRASRVKVSDDGLTDNNVRSNSSGYAKGVSDRASEIKNTEKTKLDDGVLNSAGYSSEIKRPKHAQINKQSNKPVEFAFSNSPQEKKIYSNILTNENAEKNKKTTEKTVSDKTAPGKTAPGKTASDKGGVSGLLIKSGVAVVFISLIYFLVSIINDTETKHVYKKAKKSSVVENADEKFLTNPGVKVEAEVALEAETKLEAETVEVEIEVEIEVETELKAETEDVSESLIVNHEVEQAGNQPGNQLGNQPDNQSGLLASEQKIFLREEGEVDISKNDDGVLIVINEVDSSNEVDSNEKPEVEAGSYDVKPLVSPDEDDVISHQVFSESENIAVIDGGDISARELDQFEKKSDVVELDDKNKQPEEVVVGAVEQKNINNVSVQVVEKITPDIKSITNNDVVSKDIMAKGQDYKDNKNNKNKESKGQKNRGQENKDQENKGQENKSQENNGEESKAANIVNKDSENKDTKSAPTKSAKPASKKYIHRVVKGDTLWHIAKRYVNNPWKYPELARLSKIKNPDLIYPGDRVTIIINYRR